MVKPTHRDAARVVASMTDALIMMDVSFNALGKAERDRMDAHESIIHHPGPNMLQQLAGMLDELDDAGVSIRKYLPAMLTLAKSTAEGYAAIAPAGSGFATSAAAAAAVAARGLETFPTKDDDPHMVYEIPFAVLEEEDDDKLSLDDLFKEEWNVGRTFDELFDEVRRAARS